jgi:hypothetical protein
MIGDLAFQASAYWMMAWKILCGSRMRMLGKQSTMQNFGRTIQTARTRLVSADEQLGFVEFAYKYRHFSSGILHSKTNMWPTAW